MSNFENKILKQALTFDDVLLVPQNSKIMPKDADLSTITVRVKANESATASDLYNQVDTITNLTATTRVYFLA